MGTQQPKIRILNVLLMLACFFVVVWLAFLAQINLMAWRNARQVSRDNPNLELLPGPLPDMSLAKLTEPRIERFGFSFQVPWKFINQKRDWRTATVVSFQDGPTLIVFDPAPANTMRGRIEKLRKIMATALGAEAISSNYDLMAADLQATPAQVKWWATRTSNVRIMMFLTFKSINLNGTSPAIYPLRTGALRGFQFGDPAVRPYRVKLDLFDGSDRHYHIVLSSNGRPHQVASQAEINALVSSIEPLPSARTSQPSK